MGKRVGGAEGERVASGEHIVEGGQKKRVLSRDMGVVVEPGMLRDQNGDKGLGQEGMGRCVPMSPCSREPVGRLGTHRNCSRGPRGWELRPRAAV